jgi:hypothetical protein
MEDLMIAVHTGPVLPARLTSPDVYFTPGYGRAATVTDIGKWTLLEDFDGAWQVPLIVRTLPDGAEDAISPYGYSGVYAAESLSPAQVRQAWSGTLAALAKLGVISVLLRYSPLVPQPPNLPGIRTIVSGHPTIVLEPLDADTAWKAMEGNCRTKVRKAEKNGYTARVRQAERRDLAQGGDFRGLYDETMRRLDAAPQYFFSDHYYHELFEGVGPNLFLAEVLDSDGVVVSADLLMRHDPFLHGHLSGSKRDDARMGSNNPMIWMATQFAIDQSLRQLHLGSCVTPTDTLFTFKGSFGGRNLTYGLSGRSSHMSSTATRSRSGPRSVAAHRPRSRPRTSSRPTGKGKFSWGIRLKANVDLEG